MTDQTLRSAICFIQCVDGHRHGVVKFVESVEGGVDMHIHVHGLMPGKHGFHVHRSGNTSHGPKHLCDHFNPTGVKHGALNSKKSHMGDLGNIDVDEKGMCHMDIHAKRLKLHGDNSILGRSLIIHEGEDDLGKGGDEESLKTGNSGDRVMWGIIAIDDCP